MPTEVVPPSQDLESGEEKTMGGRRVRGATVKQLKKMLKKAGLKTSGRRAALTRRAKKAHLKMRGGAGEAPTTVVEGPAGQAGGSAITPASVTGGRRRSRRSRGFKLF